VPPALWLSNVQIVEPVPPPARQLAKRPSQPKIKPAAARPVPVRQAPVAKPRRLTAAVAVFVFICAVAAALYYGATPLLPGFLGESVRSLPLLDLFMLFGSITIAYFLPFIVAALRGRPNCWTVLLINLLLGWSGIGWLMALFAALRSTRREARPTPRRGNLLAKIAVAASVLVAAGVVASFACYVLLIRSSPVDIVGRWQLLEIDGRAVAEPDPFKMYWVFTPAGEFQVGMGTATPHTAGSYRLSGHIMTLTPTSTTSSNSMPATATLDLRGDELIMALVPQDSGPRSTMIFKRVSSVANVGGQDSDGLPNFPGPPDPFDEGKD
jgi:hypothetical protein